MTQLRTKCPYDGRTWHAKEWKAGYQLAERGGAPISLASQPLKEGHAAGLSDRQKGMSDAE